MRLVLSLVVNLILVLRTTFPLALATPFPDSGTRQQIPLGDEEVRAAIRSDLELLEKMQFGPISPYHQYVFEGTTAASIRKFFESNIRTIDSIESPYNTDYIAAFAGHHTMRVGDLLYRHLDYTPTSLVERLAKVLHEAWHSHEHEKWRQYGKAVPRSKLAQGHINCPRPFQFQLGDIVFRLPTYDEIRKGACDSIALGGYGAEYTFLRSIVNSCLNCTEGMKIDARIMSNLLLLRITEPKEVDDLIHAANLESPGPHLQKYTAFSEARVMLKNLASSGLEDSLWRKQCIKQDSCFQ